MKLIKFLVIALVLTARTCRTEIVVATSSSDESTANLVKDLVKIVTSCYEDRLYTVGLAGNLPDALSRTLSSENSIPVVLMDGVGKYTRSASRVHGQFRHKVHVFIIEASTWEQLDVIIEKNIKLSIWWNHMASFLIVVRSHECINSSKFLWRAWYRDILNAKVLCYGNETARTIVNYNPCTDQAPVPWQRHGVVQGINDHPFTLFYQKYRANESICANLDFDKTKDLGGYEIRVKGENWSQYWSQAKLEKEYINNAISWVVAENILYIVSRALNGTIKFSNKHIKFNGVDEDIVNHAHPKWSLLKLHSTYPHAVTGTVLISQFRGYKSQFSKLVFVIDIPSWIGVSIVYFISLIFMKCFLHQTIMTAILNIIRITCNTGLTYLSHNTASRVYLSCLFIFGIVMQVIIQCDLASLLTVKIPHQNINTIEDLETFGYKICSPNIHASDIKNPYFMSHLNNDLWETCLRYTTTRSSLASYTWAIADILDDAQSANLHVSQEFIHQHHVSYQIRHNWALEQQVNRIIAKLVEADALDPWDAKFLGTTLTQLQFDDQKNIEDYKQLEFNEMAFAFIFLGIGLACATVSFIFEFVIRYKCTCSITIDRRHFSSTALTDRFNCCFNTVKEIKNKYFR